MNNKQKVELFDKIYELLKEETKSSNILQCAGTLTRAQGINGFKLCDIGTPVFEKGDKYVLFMETLDGKTVVEVPYNKESFKSIEVNATVTPQ